MIVVEGRDQYSAISRFYEDHQLEEALDYFELLEEQYEDVFIRNYPKLTIAEYGDAALKALI